MKYINLYSGNLAIEIIFSFAVLIGCHSQPINANKATELRLVRIADMIVTASEVELLSKLTDLDSERVLKVPGCELARLFREHTNVIAVRPLNRAATRSDGCCKFVIRSEQNLDCEIHIGAGWITILSTLDDSVEIGLSNDALFEGICAAVGVSVDQLE